MPYMTLVSLVAYGYTIPSPVDAHLALWVALRIRLSSQDCDSKCDITGCSRDRSGEAGGIKNSTSTRNFDTISAYSSLQGRLIAIMPNPYLFTTQFFKEEESE